MVLRSQELRGSAQKLLASGVVCYSCVHSPRVGNVHVTYGLFLQFELAVDAVHKKVPDQPVGPKREDIVDTMVFKPADVMLVHFRNVDFNYATKGNTPHDSLRT